MRLIAMIAIAALASATSMIHAQAADPISIPLSTGAQIPVVDDSGFDWSGFYAGVYGGVQQSEAGGTQLGLGINAGVNAQFEFYLLGAEVAVKGLAAGDIGETSYGQILGRAGLVISDDVLVYAAGGYGLDLGVPDEQDVLLGGGVEFAVTDSLTVRGQYLRAFPTQGDTPKDQFTLGAAVHF